jgi:hypothetical protein
VSRQNRRYDPMRWLWLVAGPGLAACVGDLAREATFGDTELVAVEELRVGSPDHPQLAFTWFRDLEVGPDGTIYTVHPQENAIRVHDSAGAFLRTIGRAGEGPGEFDSPGPIGMLGDTLWVLDYGTYRFSFFDLAGNLLGSQRIPIDLGDTPDERPPRPNGLLSDGSIFGSPPAWSRLVASGEITTDVVLRLDSTGAVMDTIASYSLENSVWEVADPDNPGAWGTYAGQPFSDTELVRPSYYQPVVVRVNRAAATTEGRATFHVMARTFGGDTLFSRQFSYTPMVLETALVDSVVEARAAAVIRFRRGAITPAQAAEWARDALYTPDFHPPVSDMLIGRDGSVWLRGEDPGESTVEWRILSPAGEPLGVVRLPVGFRIMLADRSRAWGTEYDELDVPYIVRYRIVSEHDAT